jgi:hypothetical protein
MISEMSGYNEEVRMNLLNPVLPSLFEGLVRGIQQPNDILSVSCLKTDIIKGKYIKLL